MCWTDLRPFVLKHQENMFVLNHFSLKYSNTEIKSFFENEIKIHEITNIHPWVLFYPR